MKQYLNLIAGILLAGVIPFTASAQKDTIRKNTVDITSSYAPVLRNAVKMNLSASNVSADTSAPNLTYSIPAQHLFYSYQPVGIQAAALEQDTNLYLGGRNFVKLGFGNFTTPFASVGLGLGDGKKGLLNIYGNFISSKGKIKYQDYGILDVQARGSLFLKKNEVYAGAGFRRNDFNLYGYDHLLHNYGKSDVRQQFMDISGTIGVRNTVTGEYGINYDPHVSISNFVSLNKLNETSFRIDAPVEKEFGEVFKFRAAAVADITSYSTKNMSPANVSFSNNVIQVAPSLVFSTPALSVNGGLIPTWDNGKFIWLPNVFAEARIGDNAFLFQAGWVGSLTKNTYRNLSEVNPYLAPITSRRNTRAIEYYGGIKGSLAKHFNFNAKVGFIRYTDLPFYINDTTGDNKSFVLSNESSVNDLQVHGDISYINHEKFTATAGVTVNGYTLMKDNARAWNTVPMELNASVRWWAVKQVLLKADFYTFGGGHYLEKGNKDAIFKPGFDLSAGVEFKINKMFCAWMDVNNILNNKYERWHNYEVYGLNLLGGVKVSF